MSPTPSSAPLPELVIHGAVGVEDELPAKNSTSFVKLPSSSTGHSCRDRTPCRSRSPRRRAGRCGPCRAGVEGDERRQDEDALPSMRGASP